MSNAAQLLERHREHALRAMAERLEEVLRLAGFDVKDQDEAKSVLRDLIGEPLRTYGDACAHVPFDVDTAEIPLPLSAPAPRPERTPSGTWLGPEEDTQPIGLNNRGQRT
jgi:hypothetical protein